MRHGNKLKKNQKSTKLFRSIQLSRSIIAYLDDARVSLLQQLLILANLLLQLRIGRMQLGSLLFLLLQFADQVHLILLQVLQLVDLRGAFLVEISQIFVDVEELQHVLLDKHVVDVYSQRVELFGFLRLFLVLLLLSSNT